MLGNWLIQQAFGTSRRLVGDWGTLELPSRPVNVEDRSVKLVSFENYTRQIVRQGNLAYPEKLMKRVYCSLALFLFIAPLLAAQNTASPTGPQTPITQSPQFPPFHPPPPAFPERPAPPPQLVYIYLYARITDQVNLDISEDRLRRLLPMIEKFRNEHPEAHVSATILFSGASSEALAKRNAQTHIKDFVLGYKKRGIIEVGYDGTDEPTYTNRPTVPRTINDLDFKERWSERASEDEKFLTEGRNPLTGAPEPGTVGGLKAMQEVFGKAEYITGVSVGIDHPEGATHPNMPGAGAIPTVTPEIGDWEIVPLLRRYNTDAILAGIPASNPAHIPGFGGGATELGRLMSPVLQSSPELFWEDGILRASESGADGGRVFHGYNTPNDFLAFLAKMDRSRLRIVHMELASENDYLKPDFAKTPPNAALAYAYAHPDSPKVPAEDLLSPDEVNSAHAKEETSLNWVITNIFNANPGGRFVSNGDLKRMAGESTGFSIPVDELRAALKNEIERWGTDTYPPSYFKVGEHYLSLAEAFQVMTDALTELSRTGNLPRSVKVVHVYGPMKMALGHGPNLGDTTVGGVAKACAEIAAGLHDDSGYPMPKNVVPTLVTVDGTTINAAQFLRLMAQALVDPTPDSKLRVRMTYMTVGTATLFPKTRSLEDVGATWTVKPAPLQIPAVISTSTR